MEHIDTFPLTPTSPSQQPENDRPGVTDHTSQATRRAQSLEAVEIRAMVEFLATKKVDPQQQFDELEHIEDAAFRYKVFAHAFLKPQLEETKGKQDQILEVFKTVLDLSEGETPAQKEAFFFEQILPHLAPVLVNFSHDHAHGMYHQIAKFYNRIFEKCDENPCLEAMMSMAFVCQIDTKENIAYFLSENPVPIRNLKIVGEIRNPETVERIADALKENKTLVSLRIDGHTDADVKPLTPILGNALEGNSTLVNLELNYHNLNVNAVQEIAKVLQGNQTLKNLKLDNVKMNDQGLESLANILNTTGIEVLSLRSNGISDQGAQTLAQALHENQTITYLDLSNNRMGDAGAIALSNSLQGNISLTDLHLNDNQIQDEGTKAIVETLNHNQNLKNLYMGNNSISSTSAQTLVNFLQQNNTLTKLDLWKTKLSAPLKDELLATGRLIAGREIIV